jgi:phage tail sheath gpL-like
MSIPFTLIPIDVRTPGTYVEVDASRLSSKANVYPTKVIIIGQMAAGATATALTPQLVFSASQGIGRYGRQSQLAQMITAFFAANPTLETWAMGVADAGGSVAAAGQVLAAGTATAPGVATLYIGGRRYRVAVTTGMTAAQLATALVAAITADLDALVTANNTAVPARVDVAAVNKGLCGNDIDLRIAYYDDDVLAPGLTLTVTPMSAGATNPSIATALAALGDTWFTDIVIPWNDGANLALLQTELVSRFGPMRMQDCQAWRGYAGDANALVTHGDTRNSPHICVVGWDKCPMPPWLTASAVAAVSIRALTNDPARPLQTLNVPGIMPPAVKDRFNRETRDVLLHHGVSTLVVDAAGNVSIERIVTEYQETAAGVPDVAFLNVETVKTISYLRFDLRAYFQAKYPRHKLADDGTAFAAGQPVMTPKLARAEIISRFVSVWQELALVENLAQFKADLIAERSSTDKDRLDAIIPPDCINGFRVFAALLQPRL